MKLLDGFISFIFSIVILVLAVTILLVVTGLATDSFVVNILSDYVFNVDYRNITLVTSIVLILAALKTTVFHSRFKTKDTSPIMVETEHGNIEIAQETITNTVRSVASTFDNIKDINAKMIKKKNGIKVFANISVLANSNIKTLTEELQSKVIEVIRETTGVKVLDVNIKVKNIYEKNPKASAKVDEKIKVEEQAKPVTLPTEQEDINTIAEENSNEENKEE